MEKRPGGIAATGRNDEQGNEPAANAAHPLSCPMSFPAFRLSGAQASDLPRHAAPNMTVPLVPPKPKELLKPTLTGICRASFGT